MSLPEVIKSQIEKVLAPYCVSKVPPDLQEQLRVGFKYWGNSVTLFQERPTFWEPETWVDIVVAQFRYDQKNKRWTLYCADRNSRWHLYDLIEPTPDFEALLEEVDEDPTGIFWG